MQQTFIYTQTPLNAIQDGDNNLNCDENEIQNKVIFEQKQIKSGNNVKHPCTPISTEVSNCSPQLPIPSPNYPIQTQLSLEPNAIAPLQNYNFKLDGIHSNISNLYNLNNNYMSQINTRKAMNNCVSDVQYCKLNPEDVNKESDNKNDLLKNEQENFRNYQVNFVALESVMDCDNLNNDKVEYVNEAFLKNTDYTRNTEYDRKSTNGRNLSFAVNLDSERSMENVRNIECVINARCESLKNVENLRNPESIRNSDRKENIENVNYRNYNDYKTNIEFVDNKDHSRNESYSFNSEPTRNINIPECNADFVKCNSDISKLYEYPNVIYCSKIENMKNIPYIKNKENTKCNNLDLKTNQTEFCQNKSIYGNNNGFHNDQSLFTVLNVPNINCQTQNPIRRQKLSKIDLATLKRKRKRQKRLLKSPKQEVKASVEHEKSSNGYYTTDFGVRVYGYSDSSDSSVYSSSDLDSDCSDVDLWIKSGPPCKLDLRTEKVDFLKIVGLTTHTTRNGKLFVLILIFFSLK